MQFYLISKVNRNISIGLLVLYGIGFLLRHYLFLDGGHLSSIVQLSRMNINWSVVMSVYGDTDHFVNIIANTWNMRANPEIWLTGVGGNDFRP